LTLLSQRTAAIAVIIRADDEHDPREDALCR